MDNIYVRPIADDVAMWCNNTPQVANGRDFAAERRDRWIPTLVAITRAEYPFAARFRHIPRRDCRCQIEDVIRRERPRAVLNAAVATFDARSRSEAQF